MGVSSADLRSIVQRWCPIVVFHPQERFVCCTPEWFTERCKLIRFLDGGKSTPTILQQSEITLESVNSITSRPNFDDFYRLVLEIPDDRPGQIDSSLRDVPAYCHLKRVKLPDGDTLLEINYMFFLAYNGNYNVAGRATGAHEGDWEHMTVRCTTDGRLVAVHYSAHRHGDGTWKAARDCPIDGDTGRLLGLVSRAGHGIYPTAGVHARVFLVANDITANSGRRWGCRECIILATPGSNLASGLLTIEKLVQVADRGAPYTEPFDGSLQPLRRQALTAAQRKRQFVPLQGNDSPATVNEVQVVVQETSWLNWKVRWGTVVPPQEQQWYKEAEHPTGSSTLMRTLAPCMRR